MTDRKKTTTDLRERVARLQAADEERLKAVEALRASEDFSASLLSNSPNPVVVINPDTSIRYVSPALLELTGFAEEEVLGAEIPYPWWPEDKLDEIGKSLETAMAKGLRNIECAFEKKSGEPFWVQVSFSPIEGGGELKFFLSNWIDITEHKRIENKLAEERTLLRTLIDNLPDLIYVKDAEGRFITGNIAVARLMGADGPEELVGKTDFEFHPEALARGYCADEEEVMRTGKPLIDRVETAIAPDGEERVFSTTKVPLRDSDGNIIGIVGMGRDITERTRAEDLLKKSEEALAVTGRMAKVGGWELDAKTLEVIWTEETYRIYELPVDKKPSLEEAMSFYHPDDRDKLATAIQDALDDGTPYDMEIRFITATGKHLWTHTICMPVVEDGKVVSLSGTFQDITERKLAEEALAGERALLRTLIDNLPERIYVKDAEGRFVTGNLAVARLMGVDNPEDLVGKTDFDFLPEELASASFADQKEVMRSGDPIIGWEEKALDPKGETQWISTTKVPLRDAGGRVTGLVGMDRDITRRKELEEEIKDRNAELELRNLTDALTGALNRRFLNHDLPILYDAFSRTGIPVAIVMLDLDGLKEINDTHGHDVGDEAIRVFASTTREILRRKTDMFIRYGGDEFMLVLFSATRRNSDATPADIIAEESCNILLQKMRETNVATSKLDGKPIRMTFSAGVSGIEGQEPLNDIIKRADKALYVAKSNGRNQVLRYTPDMERNEEA